MENKKVLIVVAGVGLLVFVVGYVLGQQVVPESELAKVLANLFGSGMIQNLTIPASGKISEISGKLLTLENNGKKFAIEIPQETTISKISGIPSEGKSPLPEPVKFEDLKVGDQVGILLSVGPTGEIKVLNLTVFPETQPEAPSLPSPLSSPLPAE